MWDAGYTKCFCPIVIRGTLGEKSITISTAKFLPPDRARDLEAGQARAPLGAHRKNRTPARFRTGFCKRGVAAARGADDRYGRRLLHEGRDRPQQQRIHAVEEKDDFRDRTAESARLRPAQRTAVSFRTHDRDASRVAVFLEGRVPHSRQTAKAGDWLPVVLRAFRLVPA